MMLISKIINNKFFRYFLFLFSIFYSLSFITWSLWEDNYYYYNLFAKYYEYAMIPFSLFVGKIFINYVSGNILWLNFFAWLLCFSSLLIAYFGWTKKEERLKYLNFLSIGLIFLGFGTFSTYSPDTLTLFFLVLSCYCLCKQPLGKLYTLFSVSLLTAFLIASRFPNIVFLPVATLYIGVRCSLCGLSKFEGFRNAFIYMVLSLLFYWLLMYALIGRADLFNAIRDSILVPVSSYNTHSIKDLINNYRGDFFLSFKAFSWVVGTITIPFILGWAQNKKRAFQMVGWLPLVYLLYKEQPQLVGAMYGWKSLFGFLAIFLMICLIIKKEFEPFFTINCVLLASAGFVMAAGSDTGLMKIGVFFSAISPIILLEYNRQYKFNFYSGGILMIASLFALYYHVVPLKGFFPISITQYDKSTQVLPLYRKNQLESCLTNVEKYGLKDHCIFCGILGFRVQAICGSKLLYHNSFWQHADDGIETDNIIRIMKSDPQCVVFDYNNSLVLKKKMESIGAKCVLQSKNETIYKH